MACPDKKAPSRSPTRGNGLGRGRCTKPGLVSRLKTYGLSLPEIGISRKLIAVNRLIEKPCLHAVPGCHPAPSTCRIGSARFRWPEDVSETDATQCRRFLPKCGIFGSWKLGARRQ